MKNFICELILSCVVAAPVGKPVDELTYGTVLYNYYQADYEQALLTHQFDCASCGASMSYDASEETLRCPFCGGDGLDRQENAKVLAPSRVVPFRLSREQAEQVANESADDAIRAAITKPAKKGARKKAAAKKKGGARKKSAKKTARKKTSRRRGGGRTGS